MMLDSNNLPLMWYPIDKEFNPMATSAMAPGNRTDLIESTTIRSRGNFSCSGGKLMQSYNDCTISTTAPFTRQRALLLWFVYWPGSCCSQNTGNVNVQNKNFIGKLSYVLQLLEQLKLSHINAYSHGHGITSCTCFFVWI